MHMLCAVIKYTVNEDSALRRRLLISGQNMFVTYSTVLYVCAEANVVSSSSTTQTVKLKMSSLHRHGKIHVGPLWDVCHVCVICRSTWLLMA